MLSFKAVKTLIIYSTLLKKLQLMGQKRAQVHYKVRFILYTFPIYPYKHSPIIFYVDTVHEFSVPQTILINFLTTFTNFWLFKPSGNLIHLTP